MWFPFLFQFTSWFGLEISQSSIQYIYAHYDGPLYIIPAKTLYDPAQISPPDKGLIISLPLTEKYFAAHFPLYPLLIRMVAPFLGYLKSMLTVSVLSTMMLACFFYFFLKKFKLTENPLLVTSVFLFLPRFLVVRSIGAPESLFILSILVSIFFFEKQHYVLAGIFGGLAAMTKSPGILLAVAYGMVFLENFIKTKKIEWRGWGIVFIPLGLLGVFMLYGVQYGDFFAYFHSGDNIHLVAPFSVFNFQKNWVGTAWLEEILFYFFMYVLTIYSLKDSKHRSFFYFSLIFFTATIFVQHRDIARYSLPLWPFACIVFEKFFSSKRFLIVLIFLIPALLMYSWNFLLHNVMPIADWGPFL